MELFEVGGCIRDELLGVPSKDIDFTVVLSDDEKNWTWNGGTPWHETLDPYPYMVQELERRGFKVFRDKNGRGKPIGHEYLTARAQFPKPKSLVAISHERAGMTADFVLARKESGYSDGRRPDFVEPGTLEDDLARRDFTMNAIAKDAQGNLIDPHNGLRDINNREIRAVGDPIERLTEDALRAVRAMRFSVTKGFFIDPELRWAMQTAAVLDAIVNKISDERIKDELSKMFRHDTVASISALNEYPALTAAMFSGTVSLDSTMKTKGRGK